MSDLLWYNDAPNVPDIQKVRQAAAHYQQKFGQPPTVCFVHPATSGLADLVQTALSQLGITIYTKKGAVPAPYHFRVGCNGNGNQP